MSLIVSKIRRPGEPNPPVLYGYPPIDSIALDIDRNQKDAASRTVRDGQASRFFYPAVLTSDRHDERMPDLPTMASPIPERSDLRVSSMSATYFLPPHESPLGQDPLFLNDAEYQPHAKTYNFSSSDDTDKYYGQPSSELKVPFYTDELTSESLSQPCYDAPLDATGEFNAGLQYNFDLTSLLNFDFHAEEQNLPSRQSDKDNKKMDDISNLFGSRADFCDPATKQQKRMFEAEALPSQNLLKNTTIPYLNDHHYHLDLENSIFHGTSQTDEIHPLLGPNELQISQFPIEQFTNTFATQRNYSGDGASLLDNTPAGTRSGIEFDPIVEHFCSGGIIQDDIPRHDMSQNRLPSSDSNAVAGPKGLLRAPKEKGRSRALQPTRENLVARKKTVRPNGAVEITLALSGKRVQKRRQLTADEKAFKASNKGFTHIGPSNLIVWHE
ncbi:hypothetical protein S7711_10995 [Stachybotrys chartarum IBT 7711]|uniref:Uncharacterized protein n=1 Tax=Stachybotrys chartarum (strain CBS 109288 / IBT 7711) TaxID=1280523 RepID=A0A084B191_STACB|nr:hypothetical protein S7711_10995 [Stachybotrys chartarum IBT 7711]